jgi:hypothetical protein
MNLKDGQLSGPQDDNNLLRVRPACKVEPTGRTLVVQQGIRMALIGIALGLAVANEKKVK